MGNAPEPRDLGELAAHTVSRDGLLPGEMGRELTLLGARWSVSGGQLRLALRGPMTRTGAVAAYAGTLADELEHHPTIALEYAGLALAIYTHDANAITVLDLVYAARLETWLRANGW
jgi:pterin-4a-carbinolamine dehydratase